MQVQKGDHEMFSCAKTSLDSPPVSVGSDANVKLNVLRAPVLTRMSLLARGFVVGARAHVCRPLCGSGVLSSNSCNIFNHLRTTTKLTACIDVWKREMEGDIDKDFILNGVANGFDIIDSYVLPPFMSRNNYRSTTGENKSKVEKRISEEIAKGNYVLCGSKPLVVSALGAVPKGVDDICLIK
jgi:hypothetical protein